MKKLTLLFLITLFFSCKSGSKQDTILFDKTYLIFLNEKSWTDGSETIRYEIYKIDKSRDKFASGKSGITSNAITLEHENEDDVKSVINDFKKKYPDSRIYLNKELYD